MTPSCEAEKEDQRYFNSPPHKKNHIATTMINTVFFKISTHILTKRMTDGFPTFCILCVISTHILTKRMTRTLHGNQQRIVISTHILTKRMTLSSISSYLQKLYFNSHPHEEDDCIYCVWYCLIYISTHILTKRMTSLFRRLNRRTNISTHILTKRMTGSPKPAGSNIIISTHILTKRMTETLPKISKV